MTTKAKYLAGIPKVYVEYEDINEEDFCCVVNCPYCGCSRELEIDAHGIVECECGKQYDVVSFC